VTRGSWTATIALLIFTMGTSIVTPLLPLYQREFGLSDGQITLLFATYSGTVAPTMILMGNLSDRLGRKAVMLPAMACITAASLVLGFADSVPLLFLGRVLQGLAIGGFLGVGTALIVDHAHRHQRAWASMVAGLAFRLGFGLGPGLAGLVAEHSSEPIHRPFQGHVLLMMVAFAAILATPETVSRLPRAVRKAAPRRRLAVGVPAGQFRAFAEATAYETEAQLDVEGGFGIDFERAVVVQDPHTDWRNPGFPGFLPGPDHPLLLVSWHDAEAFCKWLSAKEGRTYRLPTEAEWEYAARAGTKTPWWTGADPTALATVGNTADAVLRSKVPRAKWAAAWDDGHAFLAPVGSFQPNAFGLYDMHGNVWEWCLDWYGADTYAKSPVDDPQGPATGSFRTIRGGGWWNDARQNRSAQRIYFKPTFRYCLLSGFRVVREIP